VELPGEEGQQFVNNINEIILECNFTQILYLDAH